MKIKNNRNTESAIKLFFALMLVAMVSVTGMAGAASGRGSMEAYVVNDEDTADADTVISEEDLPWPANVKARIGSLLENDMFETSTVGIMVYDLTADSAIFCHNARQLMRPASSLKIMVAVAALDRLGYGYKYKTTLSYSGTIDSCVLRGDIYCKGDFDPAFTTSDLNDFVDSLKSLGIDTIAGDICADFSMKDDDRLGEGWCWDDDNPVLSPLLVSRKDEFVESFRKKLDRAGIVVDGSVRSCRTPGNARRICTVERAIGDVMIRMMKKSDNLYSESVFYHLAASSGSYAPATAKQGRQVMNRLIQQLGFKPSKYYIADGSGLSLYNYVSPELEVAFLKYAYKHKKIYEPLRELMPVAGVDGTLDDRMLRGYARGNVHAKTGTVTGVSALAGYCTAANGHVLCFSIINMGIRHSSSGRRFQDRVCEALCRP